MSGGKKEPQYGGMPIAVCGDKRLQATDFRVLTAIAYRDRFGKNGRGCFVGQEKLATETCLNKRQVTRSLKRLEDYGYIRWERLANDRRRRTYFVNYTDICATTDSDDDE
jgi:DNA-binding MarR family transcriptional regulator